MANDSLLATLAQLGYFKYTKPAHEQELKQELAESYTQSRVLSTVTSDTATSTPYCLRLYSCDGEALFEQGGLVDHLQAIKPTFETLGVPLTWSADQWVKNDQQHTILLNGKLYTTCVDVSH
jgi:hypothetical protein